MGDVKITIELPGGGPAEPEIWPDDCLVGDMLARLVNDLADRNSGAPPKGTSFKLVLKRTGGALPSEGLLSALGVRPGDTLVLVDDAAVRAAEASRKTAEKGFVDQGRKLAGNRLADQGDLAALTGLAQQAGLDQAGETALLTQSGIDAGWIGALVSRRPYFSPELNAYVDLLKRVDAHGAVPAETLAALSATRKSRSIDDNLHLRLCALVKLPPDRARKLGEEGLPAYRRLLDDLRRVRPRTAEALKPLLDLRNRQGIQQDEHAALAREAGFSDVEARRLWEGQLPDTPEPPEDQYRKGLVDRFASGRFSQEARTELASMRKSLPIAPARHMEIAAAVGVPEAAATALLDLEELNRLPKGVAQPTPATQTPQTPQTSQSAQTAGPATPSGKPAAAASRTSLRDVVVGAIALALLGAGIWLSIKPPPGGAWFELGCALVTVALGLGVWGVGPHAKQVLTGILMVFGLVALAVWSIHGQARKPGKRPVRSGVRAIRSAPDPTRIMVPPDATPAPADSGEPAGPVPDGSTVPPDSPGDIPPTVSPDDPSSPSGRLTTEPWSPHRVSTGPQPRPSWLRCPPAEPGTMGRAPAVCRPPDSGDDRDESAAGPAIMVGSGRRGVGPPHG